MAKQEKIITIEDLRLEYLNITLVGDSPLIVHNWSEKAKDMILGKQTGKARNGVEKKDPFRDFVDSLYWISEKPENPTMEDVLNGTFGFPIDGIKASAVDGGFLSGATKKKTVSRGAFFVSGDTPTLVKINGVPEMRQDMVRIGMGVADVRHRAMFPEWYVNLKIKFNPLMMSADQIVTLFNLGGFSVGIGEWRPAKDGQFGMYHVASLADGL